MAYRDIRGLVQQRSSNKYAEDKSSKRPRQNDSIQEARSKIETGLADWSPFFAVRTEQGLISLERHI